MHGITESDHISKISSLLDEPVHSRDADDVYETDYDKTASTLEKLGAAVASGQVKIDDHLREVFAGDTTDEELLARNKIDDDYQKASGGVQ